MVKQRCKNNQGFSLVESVAVLLIVSIIVIILSRISINSYYKYQERLAINELISDIYTVQTKSLNETRDYIFFFENDGEYLAYYDGQQHWKKLKNNGKAKIGALSIKFEYRKGNLVSKAYTMDFKFDNSSYRIIIHLDTGYITLNEI